MGSCPFTAVEGLGWGFDGMRWPASASRARLSGQFFRLFGEAAFQVEFLKCACRARRKVTSFIPSGELARQSLEQLGGDATGPS